MSYVIDGRTIVTGKPLVPVRPHQTRFAGDLVAGVLPEGVGERRRLGEEIVRRWLLVYGSRADEHILPDATAEQRYVAFDIIRRVADPVDDDVELQTPHRRTHVIRAVDVGGQDTSARQVDRVQPAVEHVELEALGDRKAADRRADEAGATDEEHLHVARFLRLAASYRDRRSIRGHPDLRRASCRWSTPCRRDPRWRGSRSGPLPRESG